MGVDKRRKLYNTVQSQTFSSCGNFLFAGNNFGDVFVFRLVNALMFFPEIVLMNLFTVSIPDIAEIPNDEDVLHKAAPSLEPIQVFRVTDTGHIESLAFFKDFLIVGIPGEIQGYQWCESSKRIKKKLWEIRIPTGQDTMEAIDVNCLWLNEENDEIYLGCGDSKILGLNLDSGQFFRTFMGHKDYIHSLHGL